VRVATLSGNTATNLIILDKTQKYYITLAILTYNIAMAKEAFRFNGQVVIETDPKPISAPCDTVNGNVFTHGENKLAKCICPTSECWVDNKNYVIQDRFILVSEQ
jgi:hypothetical protein